MDEECLRQLLDLTARIDRVLEAELRNVARDLGLPEDALVSEWTARGRRRGPVFPAAEG